MKNKKTSQYVVNKFTGKFIPKSVYGFWEKYREATKLIDSDNPEDQFKLEKILLQLNALSRLMSKEPLKNRKKVQTSI